MSYQSEYFIAPRAPGVRPADPPDYDGITFVYLFTTVLDPWIVPPQLQNVVLVVDNAQGFVSGMSIIIEGAGSFEVVSTDASNRMTVENLGYVSNAAPGTSIAPGKITTTSLPGPKGDTGPIGQAGPAATVTAGTTTTSPPGQNATVVNSGTPTAAIFDFTIPRGLDGPQGPQGPPGQAYSNTTTAAFTAAAPGTAQPLSLQSTTGLFAGVVLDINPIGYYQVTGVASGTQVNVVNTGTPGNAAAGTVAPSGSPVLGTGPQGPPGISATLAAGNTTTIAPGSQAAVTGRGTPSAQIFDFAIPAGVTGAQGPAGANGAPGAPGAAATLNVGTTTTGAPGTPASVTASGTPSAQVFDFVVPQGAAGAAGAAGAQGPPGTTGAPGPAGAAATITAGNTSTSAPGSNAAVTQRGTSSAAIFDFSIPRGDVGGPGPTAVSTDANNQARLGSDSLIYVPVFSGDSAPHVFGATAAQSGFPNGIVVPRFANHPDAIWTYGTFDDHFDGSSLNAKWALTTSGAAHPLSVLTNAVAASKFSLGGASGANDNNIYQAYAIQTLPNANSFTITIRVDLLLASALGPGSQGYVTFRLYNGTASVGLDTVFNNAYSGGAAIPINLINFFGGTGISTLIQQLGTGKPPQYVRLVWATSNASISIYVSEDGASWMWLTFVSSAQSGFTTSNPPLNFWLMANAVNSGRVMFQVDWVKFTNP